MANYAALKAAIAAVVKENGNNEITGNLLQQQLLAMVNSFGVGYQYAGIATPAMNPGTPDQNLFYIASTAGTYANFGGSVLADGEIAILKYNGAWSKDSTGAATQESVNQLGQQVIYDVTVNNADAKFASLSALLSSENLSTLIPIAVRCGGMSIRFVRTSDNKYVQYRYMGTDVTTAATFTNTANWQGVDDVPTIGSDNLVKSGGVFAKTSVIGDVEYFGTLPEYDGAIRDSGFVYTTLSKHKVFKVNPFDKVILKGGANRSFYFVLQDYSYKAYNYTPNYATGYSGRKTLYENTTVEITVPSDATCIAILVFETNDRTPNAIYINGYDICQTLDGNILENQDRIKENSEEIQTTNGNVDSINSFLGSKEMSFLPLISAYYNSDFRRNYKVYLDSIYNEQYFDEVVSFKEDNTEIRHDSTMVIKDGIIYDVYTYDQTGAGDNASHDTCKVVLSKYNLSTQQKTTYVVAEKTGVYDGITLDGGAGSPNCYLVGNIIHILFAAKATKFTIIHCEFDTTDNSLSNYSVINLTKNDVSGQLSNTLLNSIYHDLSTPTDANFANCQANSTIAEYNGEYYIGIVFGVDYGLKKWHGFVAKSSDFANWTYVVDVNYGFNPSYEMPIIQKNGYLYIAQRPHYIGNGNENQVNYGIVCKYNISSSEIADVSKIKNCSSKPAFFKDADNNIYLISNGENRTEADIIMINENQLACSKILFHYNNRRFNYPCVVLYSGSYYVSCSFDSVRIYTFPMTAHFNSDAINQKMLDFMES